jgi:VWFA-related protein
VFTAKSATGVGPVQPAAESTTSGAFDPKAEERAAKEPSTRVFGLYLDEFHVTSGPSSDRVRQVLTRFIDEQLRPGDLVAVVKPMDSLSGIRFARDRTALRETVTSFNGRKDDYTPRSSFEEQYLGRSPAAVRAARAQIVMSGLRALVARMGELDGGLSGLILVSEGFSGEGSSRTRERRLPDLATLVRASVRSRVLLYTLDPGPPLPIQTASADAAVLPVSTSGTNDAPVTFETAAQQTGGTATIAGADLAAGLQRASRDLDGYYAITYRSSTASDGRFHPIQIVTTRRDAQVRSRNGYWAPLPSDLRAIRTVSSPILPMRAIRRSPLIQSWFGTTIQPNGTRRAIFTWTPSTQLSKGPRPARAEMVSLKVSTASGKVLFEGEVAPVQSLVGSSHRIDSAVFETAPGRLQFDLTILRADGSKLDTGTEDIDVPEFRPGPPVILQPQIFRAGSAVEFRALSVDDNAAPLPGREFRRTEHLMLRVPTYDPGGSPVEVSAKLMNPVGAMLVELAPTGTSSNMVSQFDLNLARFAPGEYAFELSAKSGSGVSRQ